MNKRIIFILLAVIVILGAVIRLWQLGHVPPSPDWDEVALGYDAYSIIQTGKDEFGKFLPVILRSFDDYKPALYAYLAVPSVLLFGLTAFAVRFPSAIAGVIAIISVFFLVEELFDKYEYKYQFALVSSLIFAISPWSIQFSRVGFEANVGVTLNILCALFFLKGLKKPWMLSLSAVFAALGPYVYQSEKVFSPLLVIILLVVFAKQILKLPKKYLFLSLGIGLLVIFPMLFAILTDKSTLLRAQGTSFFTYKTELLSDDIKKLDRDQSSNDFLGEILDNRRVVYFKTIASAYLSHFDPNWLFIRGDLTRHHAPGMGLLYLFEFPLILIGIYQMFFGEFNKRSKFLIFLWFFAAPIPASITTGVPHAVRTLNFLPTWQIFSALGFVTAAYRLSSIKYKVLSIKLGIIFAVCYLLFAIFNFSYYLDQYFVQQNYYYSADWQYGYEQAVDYAKLNAAKYSRILVSDSVPMDKSYMFFLFYLKYPPQKYQNNSLNTSGNFVSHHYFDKYEFRQIDWQKDSQLKSTLIIGPRREIPKGAPIIKTIYNLDGTEAILIAST